MIAARCCLHYVHTRAHAHAYTEQTCPSDQIICIMYVTRFTQHVSESPSSSLFLLHLFFSLHQYSQPETVLGLRKWMVCLFLEAGKEGKPKVSEGEREQEREGGGG